MGAETSNKVIASKTSTISGSIPVSNCKEAPPARSVPTKIAAGIVASGFALAKRAIVIPSKPNPALNAGSNR